MTEMLIHPDLGDVVAAHVAVAGSIPILCTAELAECTCPDACERDHDRD